MGTMTKAWVTMTTFHHLRKLRALPTRRPRWKKLTEGVLALRKGETDLCMNIVQYLNTWCAFISLSILVLPVVLHRLTNNLQYRFGHKTAWRDQKCRQRVSERAEAWPAVWHLRIQITTNSPRILHGK